MSEQMYRQRRHGQLSPFYRLIIDPQDEEAWEEIFGYRLRSKICTVIIRENGIIRTFKNGNRQTISYHRESIAFC